MKPADAPPLFDSIDALHDGRGWRARIDLAYERRGERTVPRHRRHLGPLRTLRGLLPEGPGCWHEIIVHPPGGVASGDALQIAVQAGSGARVLLSSPGAAKWYRARQGGSPLATPGTWSTQQLSLRVDPGASLEWLPLEAIVFDGARSQWRSDFDVAPGASLIAAELVCLGQPASAQPFASGALRWRTEIRRGERLLLSEQANLAGGDRLLTAQAGLGGAPVFGSLFAVAPDARSPRVADSLRQLSVPGEFALTECDELTIVRWRGASAQNGWQALRAAWALLRPALLGLSPTPPRIWAT